MRRYRSVSSALWWVTNGLAVGPAGDRVQHRRLDLDEAAVLEPSTQQADHPAAQPQDLAGPLVGPQVDLALAEAGLDVGDALPLVAEGPAGLGQEHPLADLHRQLALAGAHHRPASPRPSRRATASRSRRSRSVDLLEGEELDLARRVAQRGEGEPALGAHEHHPPGHRHDVVGLLAGRQSAVALVELGRRSAVRSKR